MSYPYPRGDSDRTFLGGVRDHEGVKVGENGRLDNRELEQDVDMIALEDNELGIGREGERGVQGVR